MQLDTLDTLTLRAGLHCKVTSKGVSDSKFYFFTRILHLNLVSSLSGISFTFPITHPMPKFSPARLPGSSQIPCPVKFSRIPTVFWSNPGISRKTLPKDSHYIKNNLLT